MHVSSTAWTTISRWHSSEQSLGIVYLRSGGGMIQTGRAFILSSTDALLTLKLADASIMVVLLGAQFDDAPQIFFTADLSGNFLLSGVSIALANGDWLFLTDASQADQLLLGAEKLALAGSKATDP